MNILLIGYRGSGKTSVAAALAAQLGWPWLDADAELERRAGMSIKQMFAERGEVAFRDLEATVLGDMLANVRQIIALGGGVVLRDENRRRLARGGKTIWLRASPEVLFARINADPTTSERRPNLTGQGGLTEIRTLLATRMPLYEQCADVTIDADQKTPTEIASEIVAQLHLGK